MNDLHEFDKNRTQEELVELRQMDRSRIQELRTELSTELRTELSIKLITVLFHSFNRKHGLHW